MVNFWGTSRQKSLAANGLHAEPCCTRWHFIMTMTPRNWHQTEERRVPTHRLWPLQPSGYASWAGRTHDRTSQPGSPAFINSASFLPSFLFAPPVLCLFHQLIVKTERKKRIEWKPELRTWGDGAFEMEILSCWSRCGPGYRKVRLGYPFYDIHISKTKRMMAL